MERRWLISAMAAMALVAAPAMADDKVANSDTPPAPGVQVVETPQTPPPAASDEKTEAPVQVAQGGAPATPAPTPPAPEKKPEPPPPPKFTYGGEADFYFSSSWNNPSPPNNGLGVFDFRDEHGPHMGYGEVWAQYARDPIGFRLDAMFGIGGHIVNFFERTISHDDIWDHIEQAYISANLNKKGTDYIDFGRWVTPAGAEVIEPKDNWLYSRGILFGWAIPFTHFGLRGYHYFNSTDYVMAAVDQGWDRVSTYRSGGPGFILSGGKAMGPKLTVIGNLIGGDEPNAKSASLSNSWRTLVDIVATYNASSKWAFTGNLDVAEQSGAWWYGLSGQAKYTLNSKSYLAARAEFMADEEGVRFGTGGTAFGATLGYCYVWNKYFQTRAEYRHDFFDHDFFLKNRTDLTSDQGRFIVSAIVSY
jgi:hypothetical protein